MRLLKHLAFAFLLAVCLPVVAQAQTAFDAAVKRQAIETAARMLTDEYVFPDVGARAAAMLRQNLDAGAYDGLTTPQAFAARLTKDLQDLTHDKHLEVYDDAYFAAPEGSPPARSLFGYTRADRLKGNIGYIEMNGFYLRAVSRLGADTVMTALADTDALIIDMRENGGGQIDGVSYLVGFFVDSQEPVLVNSILWRRPGTTEYDRQDFMTETTPVSYLNKPVYVITGPKTFSAGEELAYDLQALKRATVVGQVSKGGANPAWITPIAPGLSLSVPKGKGEHPITGGNWEGKGVQPDIPASDDQSFAVAYSAALKAVGRETPAYAISMDSVTEAHLLPPWRTTAAPGAEAALRQLIGGLTDGHPDYDRLGYTMAWITEQRLAEAQADMARLGALQSLTFVEVSDIGEDVFEANFANGALVFTITMQPDGKIAMDWYRPK